MNKLLTTALLMTLPAAGFAEPTSDPRSFLSPDGKKVTEAYYPWAETARQMLNGQALAGGVNKFVHRPTLTPTDDQPVVRMNRDSYYSMAVVNVTEGATVTLPEVPEGKYLSMQPVTEDHRIQPMSYSGGTYELATHTGTHVYVILRYDATFTPEEVKAYHDQTSIQAGSDVMFSAESVNKASFDATEKALKIKGQEITKAEGPLAAGIGRFTAPTDDTRSQYSPAKHQTAAAMGWGGAQMRDNIYEIVPDMPAEGCYQSTFEDPKNHAFWSFTVYNKQGFMFDDVANVNSELATPNADGTYTVSLGCGADAPNRIPISNDSGVFNVTIRHYRPSDRVIEGYRLAPTMKKVE